MYPSRNYRLLTLQANDMFCLLSRQFASDSNINLLPTTLFRQAVILGLRQCLWVPTDTIPGMLLLTLDPLSLFKVAKFLAAACLWLEPRLVATLSLPQIPFLHSMHLEV